MPAPKDLLPQLPWEGPPVPKALPGWPTTMRDIDEAAEKYRSSIHGAVRRYANSMETSVERYREALIRRLP